MSTVIYLSFLQLHWTFHLFYQWPSIPSGLCSLLSFFDLYYIIPVSILVWLLGHHCIFLLFLIFVDFLPRLSFCSLFQYLFILSWNESLTTCIASILHGSGEGEKWKEKMEISVDPMKKIHSTPWIVHV